MTDDAPPNPNPVFAESTPLGLIGLAIGCAALTPIAFGVALSPAAFRTAAMICLVFGGGAQLLAGLMALANKNLLGGTLFTAFSFNWLMNYWTLHGLADGQLPDPSVVLAVDVCFVVIFLVLTYAFGFFSKVLVVFLAIIDLLYALRIINALSPAAGLARAIAVCTVALGAVALWIAFGLLVNKTAGRELFTLGGPLFRPPAR